MIQVHLPLPTIMNRLKQKYVNNFKGKFPYPKWKIEMPFPSFGRAKGNVCSMAAWAMA